MGGDVGGMAVHIAARVAALAAPGEVLASGTTYGTVVGAGLQLRGPRHAGAQGRARALAAVRAARRLTSACRPQPSRCAALLGCIGKPPEPGGSNLMRSRIRKALNVRANGPWILASRAARGADGGPVRRRLRRRQQRARRRAQPVVRRTPGVHARRRRSSPTSARTARASPTSPPTAAAPSTAAARPPAARRRATSPACAPATWPTAARSSSTPTAAPRSARSPARPTAAPFTTNATGVATGLNADKVDGKDATRPCRRSSPTSAAPTARWPPARRDQRSRTRAAAGVYNVDFDADVSKCARTATITGADAGHRSRPRPADADDRHGAHVRHRGRRRGRPRVPPHRHLLAG